MPNLNEFVYAYKDEASQIASYQPGCGHALYFEFDAAGDSAQRLLVDQVLGRMKAEA
jgi:hypothetical protein